ncbi:plasmodesmata-located protein 7-like [Lycium ferocissimum]|uniref:plasmodesmata-located protein 7-like n=1 Tax=Lycium ferocissimum TaxID=112874 RepID=UPI0028164402|nr:plasmodesmata-located protein 7-like [Lycium ferocissimum]
MKLCTKVFHLHVIISIHTVSIFYLMCPSIASITTFIYGGCSQLKYNPGTTIYESNVNSVLTSLVNSASNANFNNFKISLPGSTQSDIVYGLFQCRGDLSNSDCRDCVSKAVSQVGTLCIYTVGGALQLDGCFVKYDNISFLGAEDKAIVMHKCGPSSSGGDPDTLTRRDAVLTYLSAEGLYFRVGGSGKIQGVAQCTQDLSVGECQDCLSEAIGHLKSECESSPWGDMFLAKCYARYSERGFSSSSGKRRHHGWWWSIISGFFVI